MMVSRLWASGLEASGLISVLFWVSFRVWGVGLSANFRG